MTYQTIDVRKSTPRTGAEIFGVDLSRPLGNQQFQEVHDALMEHLVVFFRDQKLSVEQHKDFARRFGRLHMHPAAPSVLAEHPVVRTHPVTGRKCLFVNRYFTTRLVGLNRTESEAILAMLYRHIETPELSVRFKWQPNSIAFWDNRCTQHHALWDYYPNKRYGHRVTICGDKPY